MKIRYRAFVLTAVLAAGTCSAQSRTTDERLEALLPNMVKIDGGTFTMGDMIEEGDANELPVHEVSVPGFALATHEVTFELYDLFATTTGRPLPDDEGWGRGQLPVTNISWEDANALMAWLSEQSGRAFRLPNEAEWEYAARAGSSDAFPWGNTLSRDYANYGPFDCCEKGVGQSGRDQWDYTSPVGSFEPNAWGLYDIIGNVWEWTADCWNETYAGAPTDGSTWLTGDCDRAPLRGGSWTHYSRNLRPANRNSNLRTNTSNGYGIRIAEDLNR